MPLVLKKSSTKSNRPHSRPVFFSAVNCVNVPMIGRSFLIFWSRRLTKGPAKMSISTANEVCITITVNARIAILSPFIFFLSIQASVDMEVSWSPCTVTLWK